MYYKRYFNCPINKKETWRKREIEKNLLIDDHFGGYVWSFDFSVGHEKRMSGLFIGQKAFDVIRIANVRFCL